MDEDGRVVLGGPVGWDAIKAFDDAHKTTPVPQLKPSSPFTRTDESPRLYAGSGRGGDIELSKAVARADAIMEIDPADGGKGQSELIAKNMQWGSSREGIISSGMAAKEHLEYLNEKRVAKLELKISAADADAIRMQVELERQGVLKDRKLLGPKGELPTAVERDPNGGYRRAMPLPLPGEPALLGEPTVTLYHGTTSNRASKIVKKGFRPGLGRGVFFAEDFGTARYFALEAAFKTGAESITVMRLEMPESTARMLRRVEIGGITGARPVDLEGGTGHEQFLEGSRLPAFNRALLNQQVRVSRLRFRR